MSMARCWWCGWRMRWDKALMHRETGYIICGACAAYEHEHGR